MFRGRRAPVFLRNLAAMTQAGRVAAEMGLVGCPKVVYAYIASDTDFLTWAGAKSCISVICARTGYKRSAVDKALRLLRDLGLIVRDGLGPCRGQLGGRRSVIYRMASIPDHPLPQRVMCARAGHRPGSASTYCLTCDNTYKPDTKPKNRVVAPPIQPHPPIPAPVRSAEGVRSRNTHARESVNAITTHARTRPAPTRPKGRPTPRQRHPGAPAAPTAVHPAFEPVAHILNRLTPAQHRMIYRRVAAVMAGQGIGARRMAERLRHWRVEDPRSPVGWLLYAMATAPHGCPRPDCENGVLWDPGTDTAAGRCPNCTVRVHDRALASGAWRAAVVAVEGNPSSATAVAGTPRISCRECERPFRDREISVMLCRDCRTPGHNEDTCLPPSPASHPSNTYA